jgi:branched-chain amino acid transport system substrate-binding protein
MAAYLGRRPCRFARAHALARDSRRVALAVALISVGATVLVVEPGCSESPKKAEKPDPIVVGVSLGLTKDLDTFAAPLRDAIRAAEGEINAAGGLLGKPVVFDIIDDQSNEDAFVKQVAEDFVKKNVVAVIGPIGSQQVKQTHEIYKRAQILQISPSATSTDLEGLQPTNDRWLFRTTPDDAFQGAAVIKFGIDTPRGLGDAGAPVGDGGVAPTCAKLAIVNIDNAYGNSMAKVIEDNWPKRPGAARTIAKRKVLPTEVASSYAAEVTEVIQSSPDCLVIISYEDTAAQFVKDFVANNGYAALKSKGFFFMGTDGVFTPGFLKGTLENESNEKSPSVVENNVMFGTNPDTQPLSPEYQQFRTIYSSYFPLRQGEDAPAFTSNAFDAAILIAFAIQKAGTVDDRPRIRDALKDVSRPTGRPITPSQIADALVELRNGGDIDYKGASGPIDLQDNGNVNAGFIVWEMFRNPVPDRVEYRTVARYATSDLQEQFK